MNETIYLDICTINHDYHEKVAPWIGNTYDWSSPDEELTVSDLAYHISRGHWYHSGIFNGSFKEEDAIAAYLVALDFDGVDATPQQKIDEMIGAGVPTPNIWYYSFSHGIKTPEKQRYRIVWCLDRPVPADEFHQIINWLFFTYTPEADRTCRKIERLWYGTDQTVRVLKETLTDTNILSSKSAGFLGFYKNNIEPAKFEDEKEDVGAYEGDSIKVDGSWIEAVQSNFELFERIYTGNYIDFDEARMLFSNLKYLDCSNHEKRPLAIIKAIRNKYPNTWRQPYGWMSDAGLKNLFRKKNGLKALPLESKSGFFITIPDFMKRPQTQTKTKQSILDKEFTLEDYIMEQQLNYIQAQTGYGKTREIIQWCMKQPLMTHKIVYAVPTYNLADELYERMRFEENLPLEFSNIHKIDARDYTDLDYLYLKVGKPALTKDPARSAQIKDLLSADSYGIWIITHSLLVKLPNIENVYKYIIDENIEEALVEKIEFSTTAI